MRFDDTNPAKESLEYTASILRDVRWLLDETDTHTHTHTPHTQATTTATATPWNGPVKYTSNYYPIIYTAAEHLIQRGLAYVDHLSAGK